MSAGDNWRDRVSDTLQWIYGPAIASTVLFFLLAFNDATHEAILGLAKEIMGVGVALCRAMPAPLGDLLPASEATSALTAVELLRSTSRIAFGLFLFALVPPSVWLAARAGVLASARGTAVRQGPPPGDIDKDLSGLPLLIGILPLLGGIVGCLSTATSAETASFGERLVLFSMANLAASYVMIMMTLRIRPGDHEPSWWERFKLALFVCGVGILFAFTVHILETLGRTASSISISNDVIIIYSIYPLVVSAVFMIGATVGYWPRLAGVLFGTNRMIDAVIFRGEGRKPVSARNALFAIAAILIIALIALLVAISDGSFLAGTKFQTVGRWMRDNIDLVIGTYYLALIALCVLITDRSPNRQETPSARRVENLQRRVQIVSILAVAIGVVIASVQPVAMGAWLGPIAIASLFVICFASITMSLTLFSVRHLRGWPANLLWVALAVVFGMLALSGGHNVSGVPQTTNVASVNEAYRARYMNATEPADSPLYLVAAQGGGLYAAYHTAFYLARRADTEPGFRERLFAISGVSGGAVGAVVYWAINRSGRCAEEPGPDNTCHVDYVRRILQRDYLSPVLAGLLFPDFLDTFVPYSGFTDARIERGHSLERALSAAVDGTLGFEGLLDQGMSSTWTPDSTDPILLLNATDVANGNRVVFSPLVFVGSPAIGPRRVVLAGDREPTLANAMVMSARFPLITPPARFIDVEGAAVQVVDGGYFDNSGIETLRDVFDAMQAIRNSRTVEILLLENDDPVSRPEAGGKKGTFGAPLAAFFGAWRSRVDLSEQRLLDDIRARGKIPNEYATCYPRPHAGGDSVLVTHCKLKTCGGAYTLSWLLHKQTFDTIDRVVLEDGACPPPAPGRSSSPPSGELSASAALR